LLFKFVLFSIVGTEVEPYSIRLDFPDTADLSSFLYGVLSVPIYSELFV